MMSNFHDVSGWDWLWMALMMSAWIILAVVFVVLLRRNDPPRPPAS